MPDFMDSATSVADGTAEDLKSLLGGEAESATETEESEQPSDADAAEIMEGEDAAAVETEEEAGETSDEDEAGEESEDAAESEEAEGEEEEAGELELGESDHDYSQAAYERAAKIFSKNLKLPPDKQFDPNDPKDRAALKEMMDRGENFKTLQQQLEEAKKAGTKDEKKEATEEAATKEASRPPTEEEIKTFVDRAEEVAKAAIIPQVSMRFASGFVNVMAKVLWGDEAPKGGVKLTQAEADQVTTMLGTGFNMMLMQNSGVITNGVKSAIFADRGVANAVNLSTREIGLQTIGEMKDAKGAELYPDLGDLVDSGKLKSVLKANPAIAQIKAGDGSDPAANYAAQVEAAIKIARGEAGTANIAKAVALGKKQADLRAKRLGASRVAAGTTKGIRSAPSHAEKTVNEIVSGKGSAFEAAVERDAPMRRG